MPHDSQRTKTLHYITLPLPYLLHHIQLHYSSHCIYDTYTLEDSSTHTCTHRYVMKWVECELTCWRGWDSLTFYIILNYISITLPWYFATCTVCIYIFIIITYHCAITLIAIGIAFISYSCKPYCWVAGGCPAASLKRAQGDADLACLQDILVTL